MKHEILLVVLLFNGALFAIFFPSDDGVIFSFLASFVASAILLPVTTIEYLIFDYFFNILNKNKNS